jgi:hypothetical protein
MQNGDLQGISNNRRWIMYKVSYKDDEPAQNAINHQSMSPRDKLIPDNQTSPTSAKLDDTHNKVKCE